MANREIMETRINQMVENTIDYGKSKYAKYLESARSAVSSLSPYQEANLIKGLMSFEEELKKTYGYEKVRTFMEASTTPTDIDSFIHHGFDIVSIMSVGNPVEEFMTTQNLEKRVGEVFYMDIVTGVAKGSKNAGDDYLMSQTGPRTGESYSSELVDIEEMYTGDGSTKTFNTYHLSWLPIKPYKVTNSDPSEIFEGCTITYTVGGTEYSVTDNGTGTFVDSTNLSSGTIDYSGGLISLVFKNGKAPTAGTTISASYYWDSARDDITKQPSLIFNLTSKFVTAQRRFLNTKWMVDTAIMLQKEHGADIEKEFVEKVLSGVMNEIAVQAADKLYNSATVNSGAVTQFNRHVPSSTIPYIVNRQEVLGRIQEMATDIESTVRKITANFVIAGKDMVNVLKGLPRDFYEPVQYPDKTPVGMHVVGMLDNQFKIIQNLDYNTDQFLVGAKGPDWLTTGAIYSPFIPLMTTPINWDMNATHWRSLISWYALTVINSGFYCKGQIINQA